ncbi:unnamed protein product [Clavelina lepadiformis]|uniref:Uncharacterized protein n=1 Tax=Clavelina lepadiformis TaxID=159417 RepID=A0ABP0GQQ5_CLALP
MSYRETDVIDVTKKAPEGSKFNLTLDLDALGKILRHDDAKDRDVVVYSTAGPPRFANSFHSNLIL